MFHKHIWNILRVKHIADWNGTVKSTTFYCRCECARLKKFTKKGTWYLDDFVDKVFVK